jgi:hypothetical protein
MIWGGADRSGTGSRMGVLARLGDPDRHFWLARSVARVIGLDLGAAVTRGDLPCDDYRAIINRCRTCPVVEACQNWLGSSSGHAEAPPPGCLIAGDLARLKCRPSTKGAR